MCELTKGIDYLVKDDEGILGFATFDGEYLSNWAWGTLDLPENCEAVIPLDLVLRAPELQAENERLRSAAQSLINQLPDCTIDWAREGIGNSNAASIIAARDELKELLKGGE